MTTINYDKLLTVIRSVRSDLYQAFDAVSREMQELSADLVREVLPIVNCSLVEPDVAISDGVQIGYETHDTSVILIIPVEPRLFDEVRDRRKKIGTLKYDTEYTKDKLDALATVADNADRLAKNGYDIDLEILEFMCRSGLETQQQFNAVCSQCTEGQKYLAERGW